MRELRRSGASTVREAAESTGHALERHSGVGLCLLCEGNKRVYASGRTQASDRRRIAEETGMEGAEWIEPEGVYGPVFALPPHTLPVEVRLSIEEGEQWNLFLFGGDIETGDPVSEVVTEALSLFISGAVKSDPGRESIGDGPISAMRRAAESAEGFRAALEKIMEDTGSEICAYYHEEEDEGRLHLMLEGRSLSALVPGIMDKLRTSFRMFTNSIGTGEICRERIYYRRDSDHTGSTLGTTSVESYFIVPVASRNSVGGVLFTGSVRKDAFVRDVISRYRDLASGWRSERERILPARASGTFEQVLYTLPYGAALVTSAGSLSARNPFFGSTLGVDAEQSTSIDDLARTSTFDLLGVWNEYTRTGANIVDRGIASTSSGSRCLSVSFLRMEKSSGEADTLLVARDVTELVAEERARDESMAVVAHEIRTPMTALRNSLKIMLENERGSGSGRGGAVRMSATPFLETSLRTVDRLSLLVDGLIDSSYASGRREPVSAAMVDTKSFLERASALFGSSMRKKEIEFSIEVGRGAERISLDEEKMEQVIQNLLSNSLRHVPAGGSISIRAEGLAECPEWTGRMVPAVVRESMKFARVSVTDSGPGIPEQVAARINGPLDGHSFSVSPSGGLGLYIASRLIRMHGGRMEVSGSGEGASVDLHLPADRETGEAMRTSMKAMEAVEVLIGRGASVILYVILKKSRTCWLDIAGRMKARPVIDPSSEEVSKEGVFLWPLGPAAALALTSERRWARDPVSIFRGGNGGLRLMEEAEDKMFEAVWAVAPADGRHYTQLAVRAFGMLKTVRPVPAKGAEV